MRPEYLALKVGGSLFSDKSQEGSLDLAALRAYSRAFARLAARHPGRVTLITGGGAIGHGAIRNDPAAATFPLVGLTQATFSVKWAWTQELLRAGVRALPLQLAACCTLAGDKPVLQPAALLALLEHGVLPVLAGDCLITEDGTLHALSSDRVPEILVDALPGPLRIVTLTDVPGLIVGGPGGSETLARLDARDPGPAYELLWRQSEWDSTGGMRTKLDALVRCALGGAECFILQGDAQLDDLEFLIADEVEDWPAGARYTRIA